MTVKFGKNNGMLQMDRMVAFVMSVWRLTVYGSVNGVSVANFY